MKKHSILATLVLLFSMAMSPVWAEEPAAVNINTADAPALTTLNGIGEAKAEAIVAYRDANGPFENVQQLSEVKGIGVRTVEKNAERMAVK